MTVVEGIPRPEMPARLEGQAKTRAEAGRKTVERHPHVVTNGQPA
jgi:hypothetical protein